MRDMNRMVEKICTTTANLWLVFTLGTNQEKWRTVRDSYIYISIKFLTEMTICAEKGWRKARMCCTHLVEFIFGLATEFGLQNKVHEKSFKDAGRSKKKEKVSCWQRCSMGFWTNCNPIFNRVSLFCWTNSLLLSFFAQKIIHFSNWFWRQKLTFSK